MELAGPSNEVGPSNSESQPLVPQNSAGIMPQLQNMVATVNLSCKLDLKQIALHARNSEYNPKASGSFLAFIVAPTFSRGLED